MASRRDERNNDDDVDDDLSRSSSKQRWLFLAIAGGLSLAMYMLWERFCSRAKVLEQHIDACRCGCQLRTSSPLCVTSSAAVTTSVDRPGVKGGRTSRLRQQQLLQQPQQQQALLGGQCVELGSIQQAVWKDMGSTYIEDSTDPTQRAQWIWNAPIDQQEPDVMKKIRFRKVVPPQLADCILEFAVAVDDFGHLYWNGECVDTFRGGWGMGPTGRGVASTFQLPLKAGQTGMLEVVASNTGGRGGLLGSCRKMYEGTDGGLYTENEVLFNTNRSWTWEMEDEDTYTCSCCKGVTIQAPTTTTTTTATAPNVCMGISGDAEKPDNHLEMALCNGMPVQEWVLDQATSTLKFGASSDKAATVDGVFQNGTAIRLKTFTGQSDQRFKYNQSTHHIEHVSSGKCVEMAGDVVAQGAALQLGDCTNGAANQKFKLSASSF